MSQEAKSEIMKALRTVKDEKGKSLEELNMIHSVDVVSESGTVNVKL